MAYETLITADELESHLDDPDWVAVDCRFSLADTERGGRDYRQRHIPGAVYAHLDANLSGPVERGRTGRHPLPDVDTLARTLGGWGIDSGIQVIVYDDFKGGIAVRLWWLLGWLGHDAVALLDGGWPAWEAAGKPTRAGVENRRARSFEAHLRPDRIATVDDVVEAGSASDATLLDARAGERYRGEVEPFDAAAGHIPGAVSAPWGGNVDSHGRMHAPDLLRRRFEGVLGGTDPARAVCYCGSGVTANHDVLAMVHAGLERPRLYPGSWSEWITDPSRERATGG